MYKAIHFVCIFVAMNTTAPKPTINKIASVISYVLHPVFIPSIAFLLFFLLPINAFSAFTWTVINKWFAIIVINTCFFTLLLVVLLKRLDFIKTITMTDAKDRIIPLIGSMVFYFWAYHVLHNLKTVPAIPSVLIVYFLAQFWGLIAMFILNIFFKISMHAAAVGTLIGISFCMDFSLAFFLIACGCSILVLISRKVLQAHTHAELISGLVLGILSCLAAFIYL